MYIEAVVCSELGVSSFVLRSNKRPPKNFHNVPNCSWPCSRTADLERPHLHKFASRGQEAVLHKTTWFMCDEVDEV